MRAFVETALRKLRRDKDLPLKMLVRKGVTNVVGAVTAPVWLLGVDKVGAGCRTFGRPRIFNDGHMEFGDHVTVCSDPFPVELIAYPGGTLTVGEGTIFNYGASVGATGEVRIGARGLIGPFSMIIDNSFHELHDRNQVPKPRPVVLEDDVFIGAKAVILPGVRIGRGAVVGASAVVSKDVEPFTVVAGNPAKQVMKLDPNRFVVHE